MNALVTEHPMQVYIVGAAAVVVVVDLELATLLVRARLLGTEVAPVMEEEEEEEEEFEERASAGRFLDVTAELATVPSNEIAGPFERRRRGKEELAVALLAAAALLRGQLDDFALLATAALLVGFTTTTTSSSAEEGESSNLEELLEEELWEEPSVKSITPTSLERATNLS